jgi:hypothetical protein
MKIIVDNQIVKLFVSDPTKILDNSSIFNGENQINFRWPSLLEYLELGSILTNLSAFDSGEPLFKACVAALCANEEKEVIFHLYDRLFAENLTQISDLPQINPIFLLQAIEAQRQKVVFSEAQNMLSPALAAYETALTEKASHTMHDLILYLAWDRMCVWMARIFDYQSNDPKFIKGVSVLRECLIESYQHIAKQARTTPGIYRMLEAFVFYQMREENLEKLTVAEWTILSESFPMLKAQDKLVDFFYIDDAVIPEEDLNSPECYLTLDTSERVNTRLRLAQFMIDALKSEVPGWNYTLRPQKIIYL